MNEPILYWSLIRYQKWSIHIAATSKGLCFVGSIDKTYQELEDWVSKYFSKTTLKQNDDKLEPFKLEILEFFQGKRKSFSFPFDLYGTPFQLAVWDALKAIPYGKTTTYSEIAEAIDKPKAVRAVGTAIGANPLLISIPCHRVLGKDGSLTGYRGGLTMKKQLLQIEQQLE
ncbi:methylated-DNA--[protein]-cysteine S-methyltransferase [Bacillus sp. PS06]|nr:methylated-DNA--[protein]-cysteine S-methyltransferase [Bacillus sp. PS06]MBD8070895.1 methylated-DNA--[protein]-cysteine S-methyltransferase [Bacillus sp. PS06]